MPNNAYRTNAPHGHTHVYEGHIHPTATSNAQPHLQASISPSDPPPQPAHPFINKNKPIERGPSPYRDDSLLAYSYPTVTIIYQP